MNYFKRPRPWNKLLELKVGIRISYLPSAWHVTTNFLLNGTSGVCAVSLARILETSSLLPWRCPVALLTKGFKRRTRLEWQSGTKTSSLELFKSLVLWRLLFSWNVKYKKQLFQHPLINLLSINTNDHEINSPAVVDLTRLEPTRQAVCM